MIKGHKVIVVMPAYNASKTLEQTYREVPRDVVDAVLLVDDASRDNTDALARELGIDHVIVHERNRGYGGNQKTCYRAALELGADIVIMLHPDYQYTPKLITAMASIIAEGLYPVVLGSRILGGGRPARWNAAVQVRGQPHPDRVSEPVHRRKTVRVPHRLPGLLRASASRASPGRQQR